MGNEEREDFIIYHTKGFFPLLAKGRGKGAKLLLRRDIKMATIKSSTVSRATSKHLGDKNESLLMYAAHTVGRDILSLQNARMSGLTLRSSDTKSRFKMSLCAFSDVKCNGALNIMEKPPCRPCKSI